MRGERKKGDIKNRREWEDGEKGGRKGTCNFNKRSDRKLWQITTNHNHNRPTEQPTNWPTYGKRFIGVLKFQQVLRWSMEVLLTALLGNHDGRTRRDKDRPTGQQTNRRTLGLIGKLQIGACECFTFCSFLEIMRDRRTNIPTNQPTDQPTNRPTYGQGGSREVTLPIRTDYNKQNQAVGVEDGIKNRYNRVENRIQGVP